MPSLNKVLRAYIIGPPAQLLFPTIVVGLENLPKSRPFIIAAGPHRTELESVIVATALPQLEISFFAKQEYWHGRFGRWFMDGIGALPVDRQDPRVAQRQIEQGIEVLKSGGIVYFYPEGTRGNDRFVHKGRTGVVRMALEASKALGQSVPIVPIGLQGMRELNPPGEKIFGKLPKIKPGRNAVAIGEPLIVAPGHAENATKSERFTTTVVESGSRFAAPLTGGYVRHMTDRLMYTIADLSGEPYLSEYLKSGAAGRGEA